MLVSTGKSVFDARGNYIGREVVEMEAFTYEQLQSSRCSECGGANGYHREYFEVGHNKMCSRKGA